MGLAEAQAHAARCSVLQAALKRRPRWLDSQAMLEPADRHPLFRWLELPDSWPGQAQVLDAICEALTPAATGDVASRVKRLTVADPAEYHSALCELYMASALADSGLRVHLRKGRGPDLMVDEDNQPLYIELTSAQKTRAVNALVAALSESLSPPVGVQLIAEHDTLKLTSGQRKQIVHAVAASAADGPSTRTQVDVTSVVSTRELTVYVDPSLPWVSLRDRGAFGGSDPMPIIEAAVAAKGGQLRGFGPAILAVELTGSDWGSHLWAIQNLWGVLGPLSVTAPDDVVGVLAYWQGLQVHRPYLSVWLANDAWTGARPALADRTLAALLGAA